MTLAVARGLGSVQVVVFQTRDPPPSNAVDSQKTPAPAPLARVDDDAVDYSFQLPALAWLVFD